MFTGILLITIFLGGFLLGKYFKEIIEWGRGLLNDFSPKVKKVLTVAIIAGMELLKQLYYWINGKVYIENDRTPTGHSMSREEIIKAYEKGIFTAQERDDALRGLEVEKPLERFER